MPSEFARHWTLDPAVAFLNHGSFGATPRPVLAAQQAWRARMEQEPVRFFSAELERALDAARDELGAFVGADPDDLAFVPNATAGFNAVLRSLRLEPGDELLTTDHAYNAAKNTLEYVAEREGARVVIASVPFPGTDPAAVVTSVLAAVTPRTRLALLDHVTSATALVFPIATLVARLRERGVHTLVDGAHAPGQVPLEVPAIGADYYTANLHKWVCAPKGAGFLWVRRDHQEQVRPLAISHGANSPRADRSRFRVEFDWTGTADPSAYLSVPDAIRFGDELLPGGWAALRDRNHGLALQGRDLLCERLTIEAPAPDEMLGCMASVPLPLETQPGRVQGIELSEDPVHEALAALGMQVMITPWPQRPDGGPWRRLVRISVAAYNDLEQYRRLAAALPAPAGAAVA
ncbi:MAG: aminotransferase class V-fold PLP-dependent enzyme [Candidatus Limnocylindria bacterium]